MAAATAKPVRPPLDGPKPIRSKHCPRIHQDGVATARPVAFDDKPPSMRRGDVLPGSPFVFVSHGPAPIAQPTLAAYADIPWVNKKDRSCFVPVCGQKESVVCKPA